MKCRIKSANSILCPKCKRRIKYSGRGYKCKTCGYFKAEEDSNLEKAFLKTDYTRFFPIW